MKIFVLFFSSLISVSLSHADANYTVQVGAYGAVDTQEINKLESYGVVNTRQVGSLTRVAVGETADLAEAQTLLAQLQSAGYSDAFIRRTSGQSEVTSAHHHSHGSHSHSHSELLDKLSDEERRLAVYLDGKLHLKRGNEFIPVE